MRNEIDADKIDFNKVFVGASEFAQDTRNAAQMLIAAQPTAYYVDKVVEELEKIEQHCLDMSDWQGQSAIFDAIEIVKQGCVGTETETIRDKAIKWNNNSSKRVPYEFIDYVEGKREIDVSVLRKEDKDCR